MENKTWAKIIALLAVVLAAASLYVLYRHWHVSHGWITGENRVTAATVTDAVIGKKLTVHDPADALDAVLAVLALFLYRDWFGKPHFEA